MPYIAYLTDPEQHTNSAVTYPGKGETKDEARGNACYYNNQWPWVRVVAASKAPRWAQRSAHDNRWNDLRGRACVTDLTAEELRELEGYELGFVYF